MLSYLSNTEVASVLEEIAKLLEARGDSPYRVSAYRNAALTVRRHVDSLAGIHERDGAAGLERLPAIGTSLARTIGQIFRRGRSRLLDRLRREQQERDPLTTLPSIGPRLAERIRSQLGVDSLEDLQRAASDGRLNRVEGLGRKRVQAVRDALAQRLPSRASLGRTPLSAPSADVSVLLELDHAYREQAAAGRLPTVAPKQFNPTSARWLPVMHVVRDGRRYVVHFANTARSHELARQHDWVVIRCQDKPAFGVWTVVTARGGPLRGKRIVRGRERDCAAHHATASRHVQSQFPSNGE